LNESPHQSKQPDRRPFSEDPAVSLSVSRPGRQTRSRRRPRSLVKRTDPDAWRSSWNRRRVVSDAELDQAALPLPAIAAADLVGAELPPTPPAAELPAPEPWVGPATIHALGSAVGTSKLTEDLVREMRRLRAEGWSTGKLARRYAVSRATVCYACNGRTWKDVAPLPFPEAEPPTK
jgi:hypothetical protein